MFGYIKILKQDIDDCSDYYHSLVVSYLLTVANDSVIVDFSSMMDSEDILNIAKGLKSFSGKYNESCHFKGVELSLSVKYFESTNETALHFICMDRGHPPFNYNLDFYLIAEVAEINRLGSMLEQYLQDKDADYLVWSKDEYFIGDRYAHQDFWQ